MTERKIKINEDIYNYDENLTIIQACELSGIQIPRFVIMKDYRLWATAECVWLRLWEAT